MMQWVRSFIDAKLYYLVHIKGSITHGFKRTHHGQFGEDVVVTTLLQNISRGVYVDVGAYHPTQYSNTYALYKKGWHGVNIDPNPHSIRLLRWYRPRDTQVHAGVAEEVGQKTYYRFNHQSCNTFSTRQRDEMLAKKFIRSIGDVQVACMPLQKIIDEHVPGGRVDFLNIDVEGMAAEVLRTLDFTKSAPRVICVEDDEMELTADCLEAHALYKNLVSHGYVLHSKMGPSCIYVQK